MLYVDPIAEHHLDRAEKGVAGGAREKGAFEEFERIFLYQMIREMRKSVDESGLIGGESHREMFTEMLDDVWAGEMAKSGQFGIAKIMSEQMRVQERQAEIREQIDGAGKTGLPLHPAPSAGLPLKTAPSEGIPYAPRRAAWLELQQNSAGLPLSPQSLTHAHSSGAFAAPIDTTDEPLPTGNGRRGIAV